MKCLRSIVIKPKIQDYSKYFLCIIILKQTFKILQTIGGGVPTILTKNCKFFEIPVPPIEVQSKIVEILDNFTELEAELEAEARSKAKAIRILQESTPDI